MNLERRALRQRGLPAMKSPEMAQNCAVSGFLRSGKLHRHCIKELNLLDPACGSGNFLTETYLSLRRLENRVVRDLTGGQMVFDEAIDPIKVSITQFYGIEINDFAVTVAKTALWIAESQMMKETEEIIVQQLDFLPLTSNANIVEANALRIDWNEVVPAEKLDYIMGNPPFVGGMYMYTTQKMEIRTIFNGVNGVGEMDYVCAWYKLACQYMRGSYIKAAFVSTNSICQGEQVTTFWKYLSCTYSVIINFAYTTFVWNSEANEKAKVHCVIIGFSMVDDQKPKKIIDANGTVEQAEIINPYLTSGPIVFIEAHSTPICDVPKMRFGSMPRDGGGFILTPEEKAELERKEPISTKWIHPYIGATEFLNNKESLLYNIKCQGVDI